MVYGLYGGLLIANIAMVALGLVILTPCIWLVNRPKPWLIAFILALVVTGVYSVHQSVFEIGLVLGIGVIGYVLRCLQGAAAADGAGRRAGIHDRVELPAQPAPERRRLRHLLPGQGLRSACCSSPLSSRPIRCGANSDAAECPAGRDEPGMNSADPAQRSSPTVAERIAAIIAALPRTDTAAHCASLQLAADRCRRPLLLGARERLHAGHARGDRRAWRLAR